MIEIGCSPRDADALARLHRRAFPNFFLSSLGLPFLRQMYRGFAVDHSCVVVVARAADRSPVGVVVGTVEPAGFFSRLLRRRLLGLGVAACGAVLRDPRILARIARGAWYRGDLPAGENGALLSSICVDPDAAGAGLGAQLLAAWQNEARRRGASRAFLMTDGDNNDHVNRFYARAGWSRVASVQTAEGRMLNRYFIELSSSQASDPAGAPVASASRTVRDDLRFRLRDLIVAGPLMVLSAPLAALIAAAVVIDSGLPVLFHQERVGRGGRRFRIHKFRSMRSDVEGPEVTSDGDLRITRVGRWLRAAKLDELPQLFNVVRGEMSLVGPRPEVPHYVQLWPVDLRAEILSVRPGVTDPMTVELRDESVTLAQSADPEWTYVEELLPRKARAYADYVRTRTLRTDTAVLARTIMAVFRLGAKAEGSRGSGHRAWSRRMA